MLKMWSQTNILSIINVKYSLCFLKNYQNILSSLTKARSSKAFLKFLCVSGSTVSFLVYFDVAIFTAVCVLLVLNPKTCSFLISLPKIAVTLSFRIINLEKHYLKNSYFCRSICVSVGYWKSYFMVDYLRQGTKVLH